MTEIIVSLAIGIFISVYVIFTIWMPYRSSKHRREDEDFFYFLKGADEDDKNSKHY